jgi:hypothetical protein
VRVVGVELSSTLIGVKGIGDLVVTRLILKVSESATSHTAGYVTMRLITY